MEEMPSYVFGVNSASLLGAGILQRFFFVEL